MLYWCFDWTSLADDHAGAGCGAAAAVQAREAGAANLVACVAPPAGREVAVAH